MRRKLRVSSNTKQESESFFRPARKKKMVENNEIKEESSAASPILADAATATSGIQEGSTPRDAAGGDSSNGSKGEEKPEKKKTIGAIIASYLIAVVICGFVQLFAFLGAGSKDPFLGTQDPKSELTILQTTGTLAVLVQLAVFIPSYIFQTEKFYDLTGSLTYVVCVLYTLFAGAKSNGNKFESRAVIMSSLVLVWCVRLGWFLFRRVLTVGKDSRFDKLKKSFSSFLVVWVLQGLWVFLTPFCAFVINADQASTESEVRLQPSDVVGIILWAVGFGIEATADYQKNKWRSLPLGSEHKKHPFIDYGLWYYSRHPNYFGEMVLWFGVFVLSVGALHDRQFSAIVSPIFVFCLINFLSGVPLLEKASDEKFAKLDAYWEYKRTTSSLILLPKGCGGARNAGATGNLKPVDNQDTKK